MGMKPKYSAKRRLGNVGEDIACAFLESKGFTILERNYLRPWGELDIVAQKGNTLRFVEVKAVSCESLPNSPSADQWAGRENGGYRPEEQVHPAKLRKLARTAEMYMNDKGDTRDYQIDVVTVYMDMTRRKARCHLYEQVL